MNLTNCTKELAECSVNFGRDGVITFVMIENLEQAVKGNCIINR